MEDDSTVDTNYQFYSSNISSQPDGDYIDNIHKNWWGNTQQLEVHHGYIQWLFPIREHGMNYQCPPLQKHEIEKIKRDPVCMERLKKSYELMLHFYGCRLKDNPTGELERHEGWKEQYRNLNTSSHNYLRITRILKCLGEFGLEYYKKPFIEHFIQEIWVNKELSNCDTSCEIYWIGTVKDDKVRHELEEKIARFPKKQSLLHQHRPPYTSTLIDKHLSSSR